MFDRASSAFGSAPAAAKEVRGWQALEYAIYRDLIETALTITAIEGPRDHPQAPPGAISFLRFAQMPDVFMVNRATYFKLNGAFGPRYQFWIDKHIRIVPVEHTDHDGEPVWTLEVEPLWRCRQCRKDWTTEREGRLCPWCEYAQRQNGQ